MHSLLVWAHHMYTVYAALRRARCGHTCTACFNHCSTQHPQHAPIKLADCQVTLASALLALVKSAEYSHLENTESN